MATLAHLCAQLDGGDWLQSLANDPSLLHAIDTYFAQACAAQSKRLGRSNPVDDDEQLQTLQADTRVVFALYMRLLRVLEDSAPLQQITVNQIRESLLHMARLLPFCQLFGGKSAEFVRALLLAVVAKVDTTRAEFRRLRDVYCSHLGRIHQAVALNKRPQIVELIRSIYDTALSIHALARHQEMVEIVFGASEEEMLRSDSLLRALAVCYEHDLPVLQRNLSTLVGKAQKNAGLLVPEGRRMLLQILGDVLTCAMKREKASGGTGEGVLTILHDLSHSTEAETADHGSFVSDLWHHCGYESKALEFFDQMELERDNVSYLEVVLDGLPRRRVLEDDVEEKKKPPQVAVEAKAEGATAIGSSAGVDGDVDVDVVATATQLVAQVQDLFPDLGDGYVALCLLSAQNQLETVINYLLESNPPPCMTGVRTDLKRHDAEYAALERKALGLEPLELSTKPPVQKSEKVDPSRIWVGKRAQEKYYDPQVARKDPNMVEKVKQIVDGYAAEENFLEAARQALSRANSTSPEDADGASGSGDRDDGINTMLLDEYDDDYNDEYEDYEPFSVHDGGQSDDFDAVRLQNKRLRALEAEDAFWEGMRNQNRRAVDVEDDDEEEEEDGEDDESKQQGRGGGGPWTRGPARGEWTPQQSSGGAPGRGGGGRGGGRGGRGGDGEATALTPEQQQRQRNRNTQNKSKVGNHHRKDRALKKRG